MIPKKIHYIWFGKGEKPKDFSSLLESWKKYCPDYEIIEWNENNYDITKHTYIKKHYEKGDYAFASDYARFDIIYNEGGIYFDVDVELYKNMDDLLKNKGFTGFQDTFYIGGSTFGAEKGNPVIKDILDFYDSRTQKIIITKSFGETLEKHGLQEYNNSIQKLKDFTVYPCEYFYPYAFFEKKEEAQITENTYAAHHFNASWLPKFIFVPTAMCFKLISKIKTLIYKH